eukprot:TRINITY_DN861_c0_g3_i2.p1 TRINITY_DN861_c0_g3~~TRINITY_DN861_c0_g3_i2.p1  ORF type:complete len:344 (-),score=96.97 TRINITY_DN861_c0_g3_i2:1567-2598(-)
MHALLRCLVDPSQGGTCAPPPRLPASKPRPAADPRRAASAATAQRLQRLAQQERQQQLEAARSGAAVAEGRPTSGAVAPAQRVLGMSSAGAAAHKAPPWGSAFEQPAAAHRAPPWGFAFEAPAAGDAQPMRAEPPLTDTAAAEIGFYVSPPWWSGEDRDDPFHGQPDQQHRHQQHQQEARSLSPLQVSPLGTSAAAAGQPLEPGIGMETDALGAAAAGSSSRNDCGGGSGSSDGSDCSISAAHAAAAPRSAPLPAPPARGPNDDSAAQPRSSQSSSARGSGSGRSGASASSFDMPPAMGDPGLDVMDPRHALDAAFDPPPHAAPTMTHPQYYSPPSGGRGREL